MISVTKYENALYTVYKALYGKSSINGAIVASGMFLYQKTLTSLENEKDALETEHYEASRIGDNRIYEEDLEERITDLEHRIAQYKRGTNG